MNSLEMYDDLCDIYGSYVIDSATDKTRVCDDSMQNADDESSVSGIKAYSISQAMDDWGE